MKISSLKTFVVDAYRANYVFVKLGTDDGIYGVGEGTLEMKELTVATAIERLGDYLIGKNPFQVDHHVEMMNRDSYWRSGPVLRSAVAAVEAAMLDIKGKALGVPVYELLGGAHRDRIRCYANGWFTGAKTADEFAQKAKVAVEAGFLGLKWDPFGSHYLTMSRAERLACIEIVEAVRSAVGPGIDLMIEGHGRFDVPTAIDVARDIAPFGITWFEEPIPPENIGAVAEVRSKSPVAIATGERYFDPGRFTELLDQGAADYIQPDISHVGGILEAKKIASIAQARYIPICPHNPIGPIANAMTLHLAASTGNFSWLETMFTDVPWRKEVVRESVSFKDGMMSIPTAPGLGVDIDEEACGKYPYKPYELRHYRGTLTNIRPEGAVAFYQQS
ncbi:mandelate racemase/muconate lactonizing enzyme family protein [Chelativorans sp. J32]|jgi:L-alanine-DL-glutamate epimerase and related enzymes of enolase superfamily|uniref:mandelate racemase/muconate lactonizing enzyme family protein n=1 Tax=Chelativorans sp. J32 TaxID=935840 RepID=UPI000484E992|nr:mandelate racemase/muconate lactonizing enzyme family protein [Chelativorans sp. J32]